MPLLRHTLATLFRHLILNLLLWLPFQAFWVEGAVLPAHSVLRNGSSLVLPTIPQMVDFHCSHERSWSDREWFDVKECGVAILYMAYHEMFDPSRSNTRREFLAPRARSSGRFGEPIMTTRKYVIHSCTLAILMRSEIHPGDLPGEEHRSPIVQDVASFQQIKEAAEMVSNLCNKSLRVPGWATVGERNGLAVALWATGSSIDRRYPADPISPHQRFSAIDQA